MQRSDGLTADQRKTTDVVFQAATATDCVRSTGSFGPKSMKIEIRGGASLVLRAFCVRQQHKQTGRNAYGSGRVQLESGQKGSSYLAEAALALYSSFPADAGACDSLTPAIQCIKSALADLLHCVGTKSADFLHLLNLTSGRWIPPGFTHGYWPRSQWTSKLSLSRQDDRIARISESVCTAFRAICAVCGEIDCHALFGSFSHHRVQRPLQTIFDRAGLLS